MIIDRKRTFVRMEEEMNKDDKLKALDAAITQIEKAYGKGSVMKLGDTDVYKRQNERYGFSMAPFYNKN